MAQRRQHRLAALRVDMGAHVLHPPRVEEEEPADDRQPPQRAGGEHPLAKQHQHRCADAQREALGIDHCERQTAEEGRNTVQDRVPHAARHQKGVEYQRQRKRHKAGAEIFLPQCRKELRALHHCRIGIGTDEVDIEYVQHIQHCDDGRGHADAEGQSVQKALRCKSAHRQIPRRREQHHHAAAVVAAQPPEGCLRRERQCRGHHTADCDSPQRPKRRILPPRQTAGLRCRTDCPQRPQPEGERPAQGTDGGELDNAEIGEFIDIKRECAERSHQKRRGRLCCQLAQLLGLGHSENLSDRR